MLLRFPTLSLFTVALFLLSPSLPSSGATPENPNGLTRQTAQNSAPPQTQSTPDRATKAEADRLSQQALQQYQTSQFQETLQSLQQLLRLYQEMGDRAGKERTLNNIGLVYASLGQYPQALEQYQQALTIARAVGDRAGEGGTLNNMGSAQLLSGKFATATQTLFHAIEVKESRQFKSEVHHPGSCPGGTHGDSLMFITTQKHPHELLPA